MNTRLDSHHAAVRAAHLSQSPPLLQSDQPSWSFRRPAGRHAGFILALIGLALSLWPLPPAQAATWTPTGTMATARKFHTATLLPNGKVLVAGGSDNSAELYEPTTRGWTPTGRMATARWGHTATLLPNGKVLVAGGFGANGGITEELDSAELYDPATGTWAATGTLVRPCGATTATMAMDGKVLVAGGYDDFYPDAVLQSYDPVSGKWTASSLASGRCFHTATLLPSGKLLFAGGWGTGTYLSSAELSDPGSGTEVLTGTMQAAPMVPHINPVA
jgi:hypothetical protein